MGETHNPLLINLCQQYIYLSLVTEHRWQSLVDSLGHYRKCRHTSNRGATVRCNHNLILLALYCVAFPKATAAEINAFFYRVNYGTFEFRFYSPSQITKCEQRLGLTRKVSSTTAYQALLPHNKRRYGIIGTCRIHMVLWISVAMI